MNPGFCAEQVFRLSCLPGFPIPIEGQTALVETLRQTCVDELHAKATIDRILRENQRSPVPSQITETAQAILPKKGVSHLKGCEKCEQGYVRKTMLITWKRGGGADCQPINPEQEQNLRPKLGRNQEIYEGVGPCGSCDDGRRLLKFEREREAAERVSEETPGRRRGRTASKRTPNLTEEAQS